MLKLYINNNLMTSKVTYFNDVTMRDEETDILKSELTIQVEDTETQQYLPYFADNSVTAVVIKDENDEEIFRTVKFDKITSASNDYSDQEADSVASAIRFLKEYID